MGWSDNPYERKISIYLLISAFFIISFWMYFSYLPLSSKKNKAYQPYKLDAKFYYQSEKVKHSLEKMGTEGRNGYLNYLVVDLFYPIFYGLFFFFALTYLYKIKMNGDPLFNLSKSLPFALVIADWLENTLLFILVESYPNTSKTLGNLTGITTALKWSIAAIIFLFLLTGLVKMTYHYVKEHFF